MSCFITLAIVLKGRHRGTIFTWLSTGEISEDHVMKVVAISFVILLKVVRKNAVSYNCIMLACTTSWMSRVFFGPLSL